jgi:hypothetical protein
MNVLAKSQLARQLAVDAMVVLLVLVVATTTVVVVAPRVVVVSLPVVVVTEGDVVLVVIVLLVVVVGGTVVVVHPGIGVCRQPACGSQVSVVHALPSSQSAAVVQAGQPLTTTCSLDEPVKFDPPLPRAPLVTNALKFSGVPAGSRFW